MPAAISTLVCVVVLLLIALGIYLQRYRALRRHYFNEITRPAPEPIVNISDPVSHADSQRRGWA